MPARTIPPSVSAVGGLPRLTSRPVGLRNQGSLQAEQCITILHRQEEIEVAAVEEMTAFQYYHVELRHPNILEGACRKYTSLLLGPMHQ